MTGVVIKSPFFDVPSKLELFPAHPDVLKKPNSPKKNRVALLYGANGSGKSTIAQGFREYRESVNPRTVELIPSAGESIMKISPEMKTEKFFVFDEEYITQNIKMQSNGLGTIVLFGKQIELEKRLDEVKAQIAQTKNAIDSKRNYIEQYNVENNVIAPQYWKNLIVKKLQGDDGWAETGGIKIKKNQIKARVTDAEVDRLGELRPRKDEEKTRSNFNELFNAFDSVNSLTAPITPPIQIIAPPTKLIEESEKLLTKVPQKPTLTLREQELLQTLGINVLSNAKGFLSAKSNQICPTCLQSIPENHRAAALQQIENILNREVEEYRDKLRTLLLPQIPTDTYQIYKILDSELFAKVIIQISSVNKIIANHNEIVQNKIADPLSQIQYNYSDDLIKSYNQLNAILLDLENKRDVHNSIIANRKTVEIELLKLNDEIAHYTIKGEYQSLLQQKRAKQIAESELNKLVQIRDELMNEQAHLDAQRKNFQIAVEQINKSLSYIFYSDSRIALNLENDQMYHLKVNGKPVSPDKISCGERNALALSYFFTQIAKETELQKLYCDEMFLVIDDPVSSFDVENRVGILSFLRYKLNQVLSSCETTKALIMTHDVSVMFDIQKAMDEISSYCAGIGKNAEYCSFQLTNKAINPFMFKSHNEYTRLIHCVYEYGCNPTAEMELTIGNITRRVLEAFSTFTFKEGVEKVSLNPRILTLIPEKSKREYFQNSMYRLVLNTESHFQENVQGAPELSFFSHLSAAEKQRTARDVLCFMYCVNEVHVLSHLPSAQKDLENWMQSIK